MIEIRRLKNVIFFQTILSLVLSRKFIKIIFDITWAIDKWLLADELLSQKFNFSKFFELVTMKFYFFKKSWVANSKIILKFFSHWVTNLK